MSELVNRDTAEGLHDCPSHVSEWCELEPHSWSSQEPQVTTVTGEYCVWPVAGAPHPEGITT